MQASLWDFVYLDEKTKNRGLEQIKLDQNPEHYATLHECDAHNGKRLRLRLVNKQTAGNQNNQTQEKLKTSHS